MNSNFQYVAAFHPVRPVAPNVQAGRSVGSADPPADLGSQSLDEAVSEDEVAVADPYQDWGDDMRFVQAL